MNASHSTSAVVLEIQIKLTQRNLIYEPFIYFTIMNIILFGLCSLVDQYIYFYHIAIRLNVDRINIWCDIAYLAWSSSRFDLV